MSFGTQEAYLTGTVVDENISDTFFVPTIEPGIYDIIVTDSDGSARITQFIVTATTTLRARSIGHNLSIDGEHFSNEAGTGLTWYVYNSTWQNGPLLVNESYGNQVTVTEDGNFTGYWIVPETLVLGNIYTINATDDNGLWARTTITIVLMPMQKIFCIVRGNNGGIYHNVYNNSWSSWDALPGSTTDRIAGAVLNRDLHLVVRGTTGGLYHGSMDLDTESFSGWTRLSGSTPSAPVLTASSDKLYLVVRGSNDGIYYREWDGSWGSWSRLPGTTIEGPGATVMGDNLHLVVKGTNGRLYHGYIVTSSYVFSGWTVMSGTTPSQPVLADNETSTYLIVQGSNDGIYLNEYSGSWSGWTPLPGSTGLSPGAAVLGDELHLMVKGKTGGLYHGSWDLMVSTWNGWTKILGDTASAPTVASVSTVTGIASSIKFNLREHKTSSGYNPGWRFIKIAPSVLRVRSTSENRVGNAYLFFRVNKSWIDNKYIRIKWQGSTTYSTWVHSIRIYDGEYNRSSSVDFPSTSPAFTKGNGLIQTLITRSGTFDLTTDEGQVDVSGASLDNVTVVIWSRDAWYQQTGWLDIHSLEINSHESGIGVLFLEHFIDDAHMEKTGTSGDYGYISNGGPP
jgi:hypothetical protein